MFASQNLIKDPPFTRLDLICCRNVMIYLKAELQKKLIPLFHYSLRPGGILFLGSSETIGGFVDLFRLEDKKWKIYSRRDSITAGLSLVDFPLTAGSKNRETRSRRNGPRKTFPFPWRWNGFCWKNSSLPACSSIGKGISSISTAAPESFWSLPRGRPNSTSSKWPVKVCGCSFLGHAQGKVQQK